MVNEKRLIDAVRFRETLDRYANAPHITMTHSTLSKAMRMAIDTCIELLDMQRAVDAVEVVHGRWEKASETMPIYRCSICKERNLFKNGDNVFSNYCPNCGAKMDGDVNGSL